MTRLLKTHLKGLVWDELRWNREEWKSEKRKVSDLLFKIFYSSSVIKCTSF